MGKAGFELEKEDTSGVVVQSSDPLFPGEVIIPQKIDVGRIPNIRCPMGPTSHNNILTTSIDT